MIRGTNIDGKEAFREWYGKLGELRSLVPDGRLLLLTATASHQTRQQIMKKLGISDIKEIIESPDRENIKLHVLKYRSTMHDSDLFNSVIKEIITYKEQCRRVLIFCKSVPDCGKLHTMFKIYVPTFLMQHINMYHSHTYPHVKECIENDMKSPTGVIRILICTSAAGMGVNFAGIYDVINYGPPKSLDDFLQQMGRAGRDGLPSNHVLLYCPRHRKGMNNELLELIDHTGCYRMKLLSYYGHSISSVSGHDCCNYCACVCTCESATCLPSTKHPWFIFDEDENDDSTDSNDSQQYEDTIELPFNCDMNELDIFDVCNFV